MRNDLVVLYQDRASRWRWRYVAQNGHLLADSGQSYSRRVDAYRGAKRVTGTRTNLLRRVKFVHGPDEQPLLPPDEMGG